MYRLYFTNNRPEQSKGWLSDTIQFPVAPEKIDIETEGSNETVTLVSQEEINLIGHTNLRKIKFSVLLPNRPYPFAIYDGGVFRDAAYYINAIDNYKRSKLPFCFVLLRQSGDSVSIMDSGIMVTLESYTVTDDVDDGTDMTVSIELLEYREYGAKTIRLYNSNGKTKATSSTVSPKLKVHGDYTVKSGDSLFLIARKTLGSGSRWTKIYEANKSTIEAVAKKRRPGGSANGHWVYPGTVLTIPKQ